MSELNTKLNKLEKSLKKTSKQLTNLSETIRNPVPYYPPADSPARSPYAERDETQYPLKEEFDAVSLDDYNKLAKAYSKKSKVAKEMKSLIQEYMTKTKDLEDSVERLEKAYQDLDKERNESVTNLSKELEIWNRLIKNVDLTVC